MQCNKCDRQIGPVVEQGLTTGDKLALRVEDVEQRGEPLAVQRVGLAKRGFALLGRFDMSLFTNRMYLSTWLLFACLLQYDRILHRE